MAAVDPWKLQPISYGKWSHPHDNDGQHKISGGAFDSETDRLYLTLDAAAKVATYDRPPLILVYTIKAK
jgi:hypothetical protein